MSVADVLFPKPRWYKEHEEAGPTAHTPLIVEVDKALPSEGFRLQTNRTRIRLQYRDSRGLRYGQRALEQMRSMGDFSSVSVSVEDWPDFAVRGCMLDVSRDRVPTRRTLIRLIDLLSLARINQFELYTEHTFAYAGHDVVWEQASPLTVDDIHWLDDQCAARDIDLVANQNTLGHMERWLKHEPYRHRAEQRAGFVRLGKHHEASTLAPTRENADFVVGLLEELLPLFRTKRVNIGADEPWELGLGDSAAEVASRGLAAVYFDYVSWIVRPWTERGYQVEFWADIFGEHPELMGQVPAGAIPIVWQYDSPSLTRDAFERASDEQRARWSSIGLDVEGLQLGFRGSARVLTEAGENFWVAPGTGTWHSFTGRIDNAVENMIDAAEIGLDYSAGGYINTIWGDNGMYDPPSVWFGPALFGGAVSWCLDTNRELDIAEVLNAHVVMDPSGILGRVLVEIGRAARALDAPLLNGSQLFTVLNEGGDLVEGEWPDVAGIENADSILTQCLQDLDCAEPAALDGSVMMSETRQAIMFARFGADLLRLRPGGIHVLPPRRAQALLNRLDSLLEGHRQTWLLRSRPGGLDDSVARMGALRRVLVSKATMSP
ncbi:family 20 glycosylhydrolase [Arthrobacter castelli]|uniref:family 20 glycosylhydrolase n=1 Tax=Arthrobacter castelli TaxID=271431 RepID=UPI000410F988|nr:family 20 glycosylhydrolase [Arthrobacter castelli]